MRLCEDYPCCGHTNEDPCGYVGPTSEDILANPAKYHLGCDHETGYCEYEEREDDEQCYCEECCENGHCSCSDCNEPCTCNEEEEEVTA